MVWRVGWSRRTFRLTAEWRSTRASSWHRATRGRTRCDSREATRPLIRSVFPHEHAASWIAVAAIGAFHGLNPGMGWLFALALGLQRRSERAIGLALIPIAAGHAASVAMVAGAKIGRASCRERV